MKTTFRTLLTLVIPHFVNRCGTIGISLLPMLLIEKEFSTGQSTTIMTLAKSSVFLGAFLGGALSDHLGLKWSLLLSYIISGIGLGLLPHGQSMWAISFFGILAVLGTHMFTGPARMLLMELLPPKKQGEGLAWMRTAANLGQVVSFGIGFLFSGLGLRFMMGFDAATSILAAILLAYLLVPKQKKSKVTEEKPKFTLITGNWRVFVLLACVIGGFNFLYEVYMVSTSALCKVDFGDDGLRIFSSIMLVNTILCAIFSVVVAKRWNDPNYLIPVGLVLISIACVLTKISGTNKTLLFTGAFLITMGELMFAAISGVALIRAAPLSRRPGTVYSVGLLIQSFGKFLGAALAFPMLVHGNYAIHFILVSVIFFLILFFLIRRPVFVMTARNLGR